VRSLGGQNSEPCRVLANDRRNCAHDLMIDSVVTALALSWSLARFFSAFRKKQACHFVEDCARMQRFYAIRDSVKREADSPIGWKR
jgi:hypothetical protein